MVKSKRTNPTYDGAKRLGQALGIDIGKDGNVGVGSKTYYVYFWTERSIPDLKNWEGSSIQYRKVDQPNNVSGLHVNF